MGAEEPDSITADMHLKQCWYHSQQLNLPHFKVNLFSLLLPPHRATSHLGTSLSAHRQVNELH